ncbi:cellulose synthase-like protein G3 isoform X2 [Actinidia eriantha]|uniref:cellulose synthase-like protein G3 isoform X2 n=1 Tax=Actinidia eriantha TaxID=165200 RepID=UPI002586D850|nr:cellulose synthase-like protein G3 isoform X2 [Actinidia eriantha]
MEEATAKPPLHTLRPSRATAANRLFTAVYTCAIFSLLYRHALSLLRSDTFLSFSVSLLFLLSDALLAFMWSTTQSFRLRPVHRQAFPENLPPLRDFPAVDVFVCTADPYKEPPVNVVNTALSVMAYDYPAEKISVYISDDGGSVMTLYAFMEAAKFGKYWLPFCRRKKIMERCPDAFFRNHHTKCSETEEIKMMYKSMKERVENVIERGKVGDESITCEEEREAFNKWREEFIGQDHPTIIQVLLENGRDKDIAGQSMPNLIYVSRQKSKTSPHHFKAGALNALFPQRFHGLNKNDIYASEYKRLYICNPVGMDGFAGPSYVGTGCFFSRRVFFGGPSSFLTPEIPELSPEHTVDKPIQAESVLALAHHVADCKYENETNWGSKLGFRYGSLVEDYYTGYRLQCEGWMSVFCHPKRPAFLGDVPITLHDVLSQNKRWCMGLLQVTFSKYSPVTFGARAMGPVMGLCYAHYAFWPIWSIPITIYGFLPQLTLLNGVSIFPKVSDTWFFVYAFLFIGAYVQDCLDFIFFQGTFLRWWSDQRMWLIRGVTSYLFGLIEFVSKCLGIATHGFNVTSKVVDDEQGKRYDQGTFEFGVHSLMSVPLAAAAIINLIALIRGLIGVFRGWNLEGLFVQMFISGFVVLNCWPVYEAMVLRSDKGRMPTKTTMVSIFVAWALYAVASLMLKV